MKRLVVPLLALTVTVVLAACGGSDSTSGDSLRAQSQQMPRTQKTTAADYSTVVQDLYVAYFGRPADPGGLANFETALLNAGAPTDINSLAEAYSTNQSVQTLINSFGASKESQNLYGSGNASDFVAAVFQNVLGRQPQSTYWADAITSGSLSQSDAALAIMAGAATNSSATSQGAIDQQLVNNRLIVAAYFTAQVSAQNAAGSYVGSAPAQSARSMLAQVNSTTNTTSFESTVQATVSGLSALVGVCAPSNMSASNYNAISLGMTLAQVNQVMGCQDDSILTQHNTGNTIYGWDDTRFEQTAQILVYFDAGGSVVTALTGSTIFKSSQGVNGSTPTGATCSAANFTDANFNAIALGMTLAQVDQAMGCQNNPILTQNDTEFIVYGWSNPSGVQDVLVYFNASGTTVTALTGSTIFKSSSGF